MYQSVQYQSKVIVCNESAQVSHCRTRTALIPVYPSAAACLGPMSVVGTNVICGLVKLAMPKKKKN